MANRPARLGIIGCGRVAENHVHAISTCGDAELVAAGGGRRAAEFCSRHGIRSLEPREICAAADLDAILVLTPPQAHFPWAMAAIEAGKHVLVEKPVSLVPSEIEQMRDAAARHGVVCMPGHSYIYLPELTRMGAVARNGGIGLPTYLYMSETYYMIPDLFARYQGHEVDVLCHQLYMSLGMLGMPEKISAFKTTFDRHVIPTGGPQVSVTMQYRGGAICQAFVSWAAEDRTSDPWTFKIKLLGSAGSMHFSRLDHVRNLGNEAEQVMYQEMFDRQMDHFIRTCIRSSGTPLSTIEDAVRVCLLHRMVMESIETGRTVTVTEGESA